MHRGIAKRISDLNTDDITREIQLASAVVPRADLPRAARVTFKRTRYFSSARIINTYREREHLRSTIRYGRQRTCIISSFTRLYL